MLNLKLNSLIILHPCRGSTQACHHCITQSSTEESRTQRTTPRLKMSCIHPSDSTATILKQPLTKSVVVLRCRHRLHASVDTATVLLKSPFTFPSPWTKPTTSSSTSSMRPVKSISRRWSARSRRSLSLITYSAMINRWKSSQSIRMHTVAKEAS